MFIQLDATKYTSTDDYTGLGLKGTTTRYGYGEPLSVEQSNYFYPNWELQFFFKTD